jgi:hypothetical protein
MRPAALLLAVLLAAPALGQTRSRNALLGQCLANESGVRRWYHALTTEQQDEFETLYAAYADHVRRRKAEGWTNGWRGNVRTNSANADLNERFERVGRGAGYSASRSQLDLDAADSERRLADLEARQRRGSSAAFDRVVQNERDALEWLRAMKGASFGTCGDWASETKFVLDAIPRTHFEVATRTTRSLPVPVFQDSFSHVFAVVCLKGDARNCLVLDPWKRGYPEAATVEEQAKGVSSANSCFSVNPPVY